MTLEEFPTPWQRKTLWSALTAVAVVTIGAIGIGFIWLCSRVFAFLQPILVPFAVAAVMAYLLEPVVSKLVKWGSSRLLAVIFVFTTVTITFAGAMLWVAPTMWTQSMNLAHKVPRYTAVVHKHVLEIAENFRKRTGVNLLPPKPVDSPAPITPAQSSTLPQEVPANPTARDSSDGSTGAPGTGAAKSPLASANPDDSTFDFQQLISGDWLQGTLQEFGKHLLKLTRESLGGVFGVVGFLISLIIVPIYLFYFLIEAPSIASSWSDYLPLRASAFKDEVVSVLNEINGYLIAFFRGQLVVSLINGAIIGIGLAIVRLEFGLLIGVALCFLGIIPYLGITTCWVVSVILASVQGGSWVPDHPFWLFPLVVSGIF